MAIMKQAARKKILQDTSLLKVVRSLLKLLNLDDKLVYLCNSYIDRTGITNKPEMKLIRSRMLKELNNPSMTWKTFIMLIFDYLDPEEVEITITIKKGGRKIEHTVKLREEVDIEEKPDDLVK